ncbi:hypothetical protein [Zavarzinia aquatilis]|uniref:hypothetical protein n=1 Tax=Zavarzinia aquatilis TaxID=2211142 RepID=UPI00105790AF|nr:hypothetical protein [Zavarzinia aquatilis]
MQSFREMFWGSETSSSQDVCPAHLMVCGKRACDFVARRDHSPSARNQETSAVSRREGAGVDAPATVPLAEIDKSLAASINPAWVFLMNTTRRAGLVAPSHGARGSSRSWGRNACGAAIPGRRILTNGRKQYGLRLSNGDAAQHPAAVTPQRLVLWAPDAPEDGNRGAIGTIIADVRNDGRGDDIPSLATAGFRPEQQVHREGQ